MFLRSHPSTGEHAGQFVHRLWLPAFLFAVTPGNLLAMSNKKTNRTPPSLRLSSPQDVLAAVPYLLGFHPEDSLVVLALGGRRAQLRFTARIDLLSPDGRPAGEDAAGYVAKVVTTQRGVGEALLVAYGTTEAADPVIDLAVQALADQDIPVRESLRAHAGRYWSYGCHNPVCCPPGGTPYDVGSSAVAAAATVAGRVALPDRAALEESVASLDGPARHAMRLATDRAEARVEEWADVTTDTTVRTRMVDEGRRLVYTALERYRTGDARLSDDDAAWLGMLLTQLSVRDEAWLLINAESREAHLRLWRDLVRRLEPGYLAAPACLLAFAAWQDGDGALAWVAVDRAREQQPDYSMAKLISDTLARGVPPDVWQPAKIAKGLRTGHGGFQLSNAARTALRTADAGTSR